jgi:hypothetical protein
VKVKQMADKAPLVDRMWSFTESLARQGAKDLHNAIVPAFPAYVHGTDEPGQPLNPSGIPQPKLSFEQSMAAQAPAPAAAPAKVQDQGMELGG